MEFKMKIQDTFNLPKVGFIIVGTKNWTIEDWAKSPVPIIGKSIVIMTSKGDYSFEIVNLEVKAPCFGEVNSLMIGIALKASEHLEKISTGNIAFFPNSE